MLPERFGRTPGPQVARGRAPRKRRWAKRCGASCRVGKRAADARSISSHRCLSRSAAPAGMPASPAAFLSIRLATAGRVRRLFPDQRLCINITRPWDCMSNGGRSFFIAGAPDRPQDAAALPGHLRKRAAQCKRRSQNVANRLAERARIALDSRHTNAVSAAANCTKSGFVSRLRPATEQPCR